MYDLRLITTEIFAENIYFIIHKNSKKIIIVDPGEIAVEQLYEFFNTHEFQPVAILNTHAHPDHISSVSKIQKIFEIPFFLHKEEENYLEEFMQLGLMIGFENFKLPEKINFIDNGLFEFDEFKLEIIHTPGHTKGSICILFGDQMISGDTLFRESVGRVDLPGGSMIEMKTSIEKLRKMNKNIIIYPGHGDKTTMKHEIENNPYF